MTTYTYWCLEKGYARWTGPDDGTEERARRAEGWLRVLRLDVLVGWIVCTLCTLSSYVIGAAVLHPQGLVPSGTDVITTLARVWSDVLGSWASPVFLFAASVILAKTFLTSCASVPWLWTNTLGLLGVIDWHDPVQRQKTLRILTLVLPPIWAVSFLFIQSPVLMVQIGGISSGILLVAVVIATWHLRQQVEARFRDGAFVTTMLVPPSSAISLLGVYTVLQVFGVEISWEEPVSTQTDRAADVPAVGAAEVLVTTPSVGQFSPEPWAAVADLGLSVRRPVRPHPLSAEHLAEEVGDADALVVGLDRVDAQVLAAGRRLRVVAEHGVGTDDIDVQAATARGITAVNAPGGNSDAVADLTVGLVLALARDVLAAHRSVVAGGGNDSPVPNCPGAPSASSVSAASARPSPAGSPSPVPGCWLTTRTSTPRSTRPAGTWWTPRPSAPPWRPGTSADTPPTRSAPNRRPATTRCCAPRGRS